jgi:hypothetical protein
VVISSAVFHHMIFPTYLDVIRENLAADGVLVIGDWYTTVFSHPALVAEILKDLNVEKKGLTQFQTLFNVSDGDAKGICDRMDRDSIITDYRMQRYIIAIGKEFQKIAPEHRDEFLEGHVSYNERKEDLERSGFTTDISGLKDHPGFAKLSSNVRNVDPYGAAKVGAFVKSPAYKSPTGRKAMVS